VRSGEAPIAGPDVPDQVTVRAPTRVRTLDEFIQFLVWVEAAVGRVERPVRPITGDRFLL